MVRFSKNSLKQKLSEGHRIYGTCITANTPAWPDLVAGAGLDFVFIDTEHIPIDRSELSKMCRTYKTHGLTPIVRIPKPDKYRASQVLDDGAIGVIVPYIEQVHQIKDLIGAVKYRPLKGEKLEEIMEGKIVPTPELGTYVQNINEGNLCIANIESIPAVEKLDQLLSVDGLDGVFIGPHDLSINMGIPEQYDHPDFIATVRTIVQKARKFTLGVGIHFSLTPQRQIDWIKEGVNIVIHSSDMALFSQRLHEDINLFKQSVGEEISTRPADNTTTI